MRPDTARRFLRLVLWLLIACCTWARAASAISIDIGSATAQSGSTVPVAVTLRTMGAEVVGTQNLVTFAPPLRIAALPNGAPDCTVSPGIQKGATSFRFWPPECVGQECTSTRAFVLAFDNSSPIPDGSVLYTCRVTVDADAAAGDYPLINSDLGASDSQGNFLNASGSNGQVQVLRSGLMIDIDDAEATAGEDVLVGVRITTLGIPVIAIQNRIDFAPPLRVAALPNGQPDCTVDAAINKPATTFHFFPAGCSSTGCTAVRAVVLAFDNVEIIPDGATLYTCRISVDASAMQGTYVLRSSETAGSDASANLLPASGRDGEVTVFLDDALVAIEVGDVRAVSGQQAIVAVSLRALSAEAPDVAGTQNEIFFDPTTPIAVTEDGEPDCSVNPDIHKDGTSFLFLPPECTVGVDCAGVRAFVLALDNTTPIADGAVLYRCGVKVAADATVGTYPLTNENAVAGDPSGNPVAARARSGQVEVICAGDCDHNGQVAIFELLRGVNILLGNDALSVCQMFDSDGSGDVNVNEVVQAVSSALRGCRLPRSDSSAAPNSMPSVTGHGLD